ncbi:MAG: DMT family transporter [Clostridiaceae bacterium]
MTESMGKKSKTSVILLLNLSVMLFGLSSVIGKFVEASPVMVAWGRVVTSVIILFFIMKFKKEDFTLEGKKDIMLAILGGVILAVHWTTFFQSVQVASVAIGTITFSTFPLFLIFLEPIIFKEKFQKKNLLYVVIILIGVIITIPEFSTKNTMTVGIIWGMISSLSYALLTLINRSLSSRYKGIKISIYEQAAAAIVLLPVMLLTYKQPTLTDIIGISAIGIFCTAIGYSLFVSAQRYVTAQQAGIFSSMETVYGILFAFIFLKDFPTIREIIGGLIILGVAVYSSLESKGQDA